MAVTDIAASFLITSLLPLIVATKIWFWVRVLLRQRPTLTTVPGPKWAAWTRFWIVKTLASGRSAEKFVEVNKQYGSLARIGPNHLITSDPGFTRKILAARSGYARGPWFDSIRIDPHVPNIVSERDEKKHSKLRYKLSASYSNKNVRAMEPVIDDLLLDWIHHVEKNWASPPGKLRSFDIGKRIQFLTVDIITKICVGTELGCVASDSDKHDFLSTVEQGNAVCQHFSVLLELNSLMYYITKIPIIGRLITPKAEDQSGVGKIMAICKKALDQRIKNGTKNTNDMLGHFLDKGIPQHQVDAEMVIALVAGSDTTSTAVQSTLLAIILSPRIYQALKAEILSAVARGLVSYPIQESEAKQLPYLRACILEGLRKFPPLSQLRERVVPAEGAFFREHRIPGGTFIGLNAWGTQRDEVFGDDPETYRPERWLIDDQERLKAMLQTQELVFGHGPTKCLGMPMAMMELYKMIFEVLRHFEISIADPHRPWSSTCYGIFFQKDFNVCLTKATY